MATVQSSRPRLAWRWRDRPHSVVAIAARARTSAAFGPTVADAHSCQTPARPRPFAGPTAELACRPRGPQILPGHRLEPHRRIERPAQRGPARHHAVVGKQAGGPPFERFGGCRARLNFGCCLCEGSDLMRIL